MSTNIEETLRAWFAGAKKVVLVGIGNPIRTDDYVGLKIVKALEDKLAPTVLLLEAETVPESHLQDIEDFKPSHVLLVDAAYLGLKPGDATLFAVDEVASFSAISTHLLPLRIFCDLVKEETGAKIGLLLVQPESMEFGEGLTAKVEASAKELAVILVGLLA